MTSVLRREASITKLVAFAVEPALLVPLPELPELSDVPVEEGAPVFPGPELAEKVGVVAKVKEFVSKDAEVAGADGPAPDPPARLES